MIMTFYELKELSLHQLKQYMTQHKCYGLTPLPFGILLPSVAQRRICPSIRRQQEQGGVINGENGFKNISKGD